MKLKHFKKSCMGYTIVLLNLLFFYVQNASAQCATPTSISTLVIVNAYSSLHRTGLIFDMSLYDTFDNVVLPWQPGL